MKKKVLFIILSVFAILLISNFTFSASTTQQAVSAPQTTTKITKYFYAGALIASKSSDNPTTTQYYIQDHLGSNMKVFDNGVLEQTNKYYAFGETTSTGVSDNKYKYTGKELDSETGLYYYGARYYKPELGRFIQADVLKGSIGDPLSMNRYAYTRNNPLKFIDPSGNAELNAQAINSIYGTKKMTQTTQAAAVGGVPAQKILTYFQGDYLRLGTFGSLENAAEKTGVDINSLTGAIFQEGFNEELDTEMISKKGRDMWIMSFEPVGLEAFGNELDSLKENGYLRKDYNGFSFETGPMGQQLLYENEAGEKFKEGYFANQDAMVEGFAALYKSRQDQFLGDANKLGYDTSKLLQQQKDAWSYMYYVNPSVSRSQLAQNGPGWITQPATDSSTVRWKGQRAAATAQFLRNENIFTTEKPK